MGCALRRDRTGDRRRHDAGAEQRLDSRRKSRPSRWRTKRRSIRAKRGKRPRITRMTRSAWRNIRADPRNPRLNLFACCCATRRSLRRTGSIGSTTTWFAPARSLGRDRMRRSSTSARRTSFSPPRPTAIRSTAALDPREGGRIAVAEAARNLTCSGAMPLGRDRQPELRQSLQAGKFLAIARGGRRTGGSLPRFRHAGHWRQCLALQ